MDKKEFEIFLKNFKEAVDRTIGESFIIERKKLKELDGLNERLFAENHKLYDFIAEQKRVFEEIKEDLKPLDCHDNVQIINSKIDKILERC